MRPRSGPRTSIVVLLILASLAAACANVPPRRDDTPEILVLREDYLRAHPNGPFNPEIARGEVALGMGYSDMLAAWGMPDARLADPDMEQEQWTYVLRSDNGVDWVRYDFLFANRLVAEWEISRNVGTGFATIRDDPRGVSLRVPPSNAPSLGDDARKGGAGAMIR